MTKLNHLIVILVSFWLLSCSKDSPKPSPTLLTITQNPISPGGAFSLTGTNFDLTAANNMLKFGTTEVAVQSSTATSISAKLPQNFVTGQYEVSVTVNGMTGKLPVKVDVTPDAPSISDIIPASGVPGTVITVKGTNFDATAANNILTLGASTSPVSIISATATSFTFAIPSNTTPGNYTLHLTVKQNNESSTIANSATGIDVLPATPAITSFSPSAGVGGSSLTITGGNFSSTPGNNIVTFGVVNATVTAASTSQLTVTIPEGLNPGQLQFSVTTVINSETSATTLSASPFGIMPPTPTITNSSAVGIEGGSINIIGTNFGFDASNITVKFGTVPGSVTLDNGGTQLTVTVPSGLTLGSSYALTVMTTVNNVSSSIATSPNNFTLISLPSVTSYTITAQDEISAPAGGTIGSDGGSPVTQRGVCWSVNANPTLTDSFTNDGSGTGNFDSYIIGLSPGVTYHARAYASNSAGTSYGGDVTFTTTTPIVPNGLIAFYRLDYLGNAGTAFDHSGNGLNLNLTGTAFAPDKNGKASSAISFSGTNAKASGANLNFQNATSLSVSFWMYGTSHTTSTEVGPIYFQEESALTGDFVFYDETVSSLTDYTRLYNASTNQVSQLVPSTISRNTWHHVVVTFDQTMSGKVYIDGALNISNTKSGGFQFGTNVYLQLGAIYGNNYWQGILDNVRIYNRVLSPSEVTQLYNE